ncbi:phosphoglucosamine mutase [Thermosyntropha lipolytica DSM 11003]|uniref:Phosphoglucosamine mutase n=1 Tax=Thermosyntropha lipolytica DSM 11003 TaxID=1123382 RepID=A0A1M5LXD0_9FIRM|nr:phosphoglucosamine mutase [Thermosyntropha lipolytica]SHG69754.1 phosphoglucosamine mutase [Thermosyntropha lipolytica DSM 11003]
MGTLFGTDGVRGIANAELTPEMAFALGRAGSYVLSASNYRAKPCILVGRDTRISGDMLEAALIAGICSTGADVLRAGVITTPAVAYLTRAYKASCGIVISASHNPVEDNGIKFFGPDGYKLPDEVEEEIEKLVREGTDSLPRPVGAAVGRIYELDDALSKYIDYLQGAYELEEDLKGLTVVLDCAHGAAYKAGPMLWERLGAKVIPINNKPDGVNINYKCGSTHMESLKEAVKLYQADLGIAYDGDADRCLAVDERGKELDGDQIMLICALDMKRRGILKPLQVVATVMSNIGLEVALRRENISVISCKVGDRYVLEKMKETGSIIGGEQSGHIIFSRYATTGDGLLTSIKLAEVVKRSGLPLSQLAGEMTKYPQILVNVRVENKEEILKRPAVVEVLKEAEARLGDCGKLVVRPSGTEPLVRIMAQGPDEALLKEVIAEIKEAVEKES